MQAKHKQMGLAPVNIVSMNDLGCRTCFCFVLHGPRCMGTPLGKFPSMHKGTPVHAGFPPCFSLCPDVEKYHSSFISNKSNSLNTLDSLPNSVMWTLWPEEPLWFRNVFDHQLPMGNGCCPWHWYPDPDNYLNSPYDGVCEVPWNIHYVHPSDQIRAMYSR